MIQLDQLEKEVTMQAVRSSGKGGQNVNKVSTKVELYFDIENSTLFNDEQKQQIKTKLETRINSDGVLKITCDQWRSQLKNRQTAIAKLADLLQAALIKPKARKKTKPSAASQQRRIEGKIKQSLKKQNRNFKISDN